MPSTTGLTSASTDYRLFQFASARLLLSPFFRFESFYGGGCLRLFLASTGAPAEEDPFPNRLHDKGFIVLRPAFRNQFIDGTLRRNTLQQLLQLTFGVDVDRFLGHFFKALLDRKSTRLNSSHGYTS